MFSLVVTNFDKNRKGLSCRLNWQGRNLPLYVSKKKKNLRILPANAPGNGWVVFASFCLLHSSLMQNGKIKTERWEITENTAVSTSNGRHHIILSRRLTWPPTVTYAPHYGTERYAHRFVPARSVNSKTFEIKRGKVIAISNWQRIVKQKCNFRERISRNKTTTFHFSRLGGLGTQWLDKCATLPHEQTQIQSIDIFSRDF